MCHPEFISGSEKEKVILNLFQDLKRKKVILNSFQDLKRKRSS